MTAFCGRIVFYFSPLLQKFKHIWLQSSVFWSVKWFTNVYRFVYVLFRAKLMRLYVLLAAITTSSRTFQAQSSVFFNGHKLGTESLIKCDKFDEFHRALIRTTTHQVQVWWQESLSRSGEWANKSFRVTLLSFKVVCLFAIAQRFCLLLACFWFRTRGIFHKAFSQPHSGFSPSFNVSLHWSVVVFADRGCWLCDRVLHTAFFGLFPVFPFDFPFAISATAFWLSAAENCRVFATSLLTTFTQDLISLYCVGAIDAFCCCGECRICMRATSRLYSAIVRPVCCGVRRKMTNRCGEFICRSGIRGFICVGASDSSRVAVAECRESVVRCIAFVAALW